MTTLDRFLRRTPVVVLGLSMLLSGAAQARDIEAAKARAKRWLKLHRPVPLQHLAGVGVGGSSTLGPNWPGESAKKHYANQGLLFLTNYMGAARAGVHLSGFYSFFPTRFLGVRFDAAYVPLRYVPKSLRIDDVVTQPIRVGQRQLRGAVVLQIPLFSIAPALAVGVGRMQLRTKELPGSTGTTKISLTTLNISANVKAHLNDWVFVGGYLETAWAWHPGRTEQDPAIRLPSFGLCAGVSFRPRRFREAAHKALARRRPKPTPSPSPQSQIVLPLTPQKNPVPQTIKDTRALMKALERVHFDFDSAELTAAAVAELEGVADYLTEHTNLGLRIIGHADNRGSEQYNLELSRRRAEAVRDHLVEAGITTTRLTVEARGSEDPRAHGQAELVHAENRRIEFVLTNADE